MKSDMQFVMISVIVSNIQQIEKIITHKSEYFFHEKRDGETPSLNIR